MKLSEIKQLSEGEVIANSFGKKVHNPKVDIPAGYERFELDQKEGSNVAKIIGISGTSRKVISTAHADLAKELVKIYNSGGYGDSKLTPVSGIQAWGSPEMVALEAANIKFAEKPSDWDDFENNGFAAKYTIHEIQLKKIEKTIGQLKTYSGKEIFGTHFPKGPLVSFKKKPAENVCIISISTGKYLVDTTQANSYIRMWAKIAD